MTIMDNARSYNCVMKRIVCIALLVVVATSCYKEVNAGDVSGSWRSLREEWTIIDNGESSVFGYENPPDEESAILRIYHSSFYIIDGSYSASKSFTLEYSDQFSSVDDETKGRAVRKMSARLRKDKITGSTGETWVIRDVDGDVMSVDYDSGKKDGETRRKGRLVFLRVGDTVVRE